MGAHLIEYDPINGRWVFRVSPLPIMDLPEQLLHNILHYVGPTSYLYVGLTSLTFWEVYK